MEIRNTKAEEFFLENFNIDRVFNTIERADYLVLYYIECCEHQLSSDEKVYLSSLSEAMNVPIPELSQAMQKLQDKGYVSWKTDSDAGKTYVKLTNNAIELMKAAKKRMKVCYEKIQAQIGTNELEQTIQTMKKITDILKEE